MSFSAHLPVTHYYYLLFHFIFLNYCFVWHCDARSVVVYGKLVGWMVVRGALDFFFLKFEPDRTLMMVADVVLLLGNFFFLQIFVVLKC